MLSKTLKAPVPRGNLLPTSPIAEAVARRALQVGDLVRMRRKVALAYKRTQNEDQRMALMQLDRDLAQHNIDIPALRRESSKRTRNPHDSDNPGRYRSSERSGH